MKRIVLLAAALVMFTAGWAKKPITFIQLSDPQFGMFDENKSFHRDTKNMEKAVKAVNKIKPDFVIITGDFVHDVTSKEQIAEAQRCFKLIDKKIPVYLVPGNHDVGDAWPAQVAEFNKNYGPDKHSFAYGNSYFIGINTELIKEKLPEAEKEQFEWLKTELAKAARYDHIVIFGHRPPFVNNPDEKQTFDNFPSKYRQKYLDLFVKSGVDLMMWGHLHINSTMEYKGITQIISTAVGRPLGSNPVSGFQMVKMSPTDIDIYFCGLSENNNNISLWKVKSKEK